MSIAILGGTGFIGSAVAARLVERGVHPVVMARGQHPVDLPFGCIFEAANRMDADGLAAIFAAHKVHTVIDIYPLGLLNTSTVLQAMENIGGRYVPLSSVDVYSNYGGLLGREQPEIQQAPARESDPLRNFRHPYRGNPHRPKGVDDALFDDYDKILVEDAALSNSHFSTTVIRAPMIFGPGDKQRRFAWVVDAIHSGKPIQVDERAANWPNSYGYVVDVAEAIVHAALAPQAAGQIYNVGQSIVRNPVQWLERFATVMNRTISIEITPPETRGLLWERAEASDLRYPLTLDTSKIRAELGYAEPTSEQDALLAVIAAGG